MNVHNYFALALAMEAGICIASFAVALKYEENKFAVAFVFATLVTAYFAYLESLRAVTCS